MININYKFIKFSLTDLKKQTLGFVHRQFKQIFKFHGFERMSLTKLQVKTFFLLVNPKLYLSLIG